MEVFIIIVLLVIAAETTYLTVKSGWAGYRTQQAPVFVDTSVLIDGRIVAIAESGFISRPLYIPRSVVGELQFLADNADSEKRTRARHGLDVISILQDTPAAKVMIFNDSVRAEEGVDNRLLSLAKKHNGSVCTIDYNLNKVAVVEGIEVLNVNELAKTLRMAYLPGERMLLELTQKGNDSHQGVGHLTDGTMVVVEHAYKQIGNKVEIEFIRSLQTAAGKMMFAKLVKPADVPAKAQKAVRKDKVATLKTIGRKAPLAPAVQAETPSNETAPEKVKPARSPKPSTNAQPSQPRRQNNRRRQSPEDSMVELANS